MEEIITKKCRKCGGEKPESDFRIGRWVCKLCRAKYNRYYYLGHKVESGIRHRQYYLSHKEENKIACRRWKFAHPNHYKQWALGKRNELNLARKLRHLSHVEEDKIYMKHWYLLHRDESIAWRKEWYLSHRERAKAYSKQYVKEHLDERKIYNHLRRSREKGNGGSFTLQEWNKLCEYYSPDGKCLCCGKTKSLTIDHVLPIMLGGSSNINNLQCICKSCNSSKRIKYIDYRPDGGAFALLIPIFIELKEQRERYLCK